MPVTQYIGARYMPIFADPPEHSSAKSYEPLTIVLHEGNSYTSKQFVPKGIAIDNDTYWAETGNYNAQVEAYRQETLQALDAANAAQNDIDTLLPKAEFSAENTVKDYIDAIVEDEDANIKAFQGSLAAITSIDNARVVFKNAYDSDNSTQGGTVFSMDGNYSPDSNTVCYAAVMGADDNRRLDIFSLTGRVVGTVSLPNGHYGCVTFDRINSLYLLNYTSTSEAYGTLFKVNVSNPAAPRIVSTYQVDRSYGASLNFYYKDGKVIIGNLSAMNVNLYAWDLESNTYEFLVTIKRNAYPSTGHNFGHFTYDYAHDLFIQSGYGPNGITVFDNAGNQISSVAVNEILNYSTVGEVEEVSVFGEHVWFHSQINELAITVSTGGRVRMGVYYFNSKAKNLNSFVQLTSFLAACSVDATQTEQMRFDGNTPVFKYFEDACNYARYVNTIGKEAQINVISAYPYACAAKSVNAVIQRSGAAGSIPAIAIYDSIVELGPSVLVDDGETYFTISETTTMCYLTHTIMRHSDTFSSVTHPSSTYLMRINRSQVDVVSLFDSLCITSTILATSINNCTLQTGSKAYVLNKISSTKDSSSHIFQQTEAA